MLSTFYQRLRRLDDAKNAVAEASRNIPSWVEPKLNLSQSYFLERNYDSARYINEKVIRSAPEFAKAYVQQANLYSFLANIDDADNYYKKALSLDSLDPVVYCNYSKFLLRNGNVEAALDLINQALLIEVYYFETYLIKAEINHFLFLTASNRRAIAMQQYAKKAYELYIKSMQLSPNNAMVKARYAYFLETVANNLELISKDIISMPDIEKGQRERQQRTALIRLARRYYSEAVRTDPFLFFAQYGLLNSYITLDNKNGANKVLDDLNSLTSENPEAYYYLAKYHAEQGKIRRAKKSIKTAINSDNSNLLFYIKLLELEGIKNTTENDAKNYLTRNFDYLYTSAFSRSNLIRYQFFYN
jgi:Tfp pilus assembly protein PilF